VVQLLAENFRIRLKDFILFYLFIAVYSFLGVCSSFVSCLSLFFCVGHAFVILREWQA
jgi:hypothetical protein